MKLRAFLVCSVVCLVAASAISSCSSPGNSQPASISVPQPTAYSIGDGTPPDNNSNFRDGKGEPYVSGNIKVVAVEIKEKNTRFAYELDIRYPRIDNPRTRQELRFNSYVRNVIQRNIKDFKQFCSKNRKYPNGEKRDMEYYLGTTYEVFYATPELLSINLTMESFTGYLNADWYPVPLNYDLKAGTPLRNLASLFKPRSKYLESIATYCVDELMRRGLNCGGGGVGNEQELRKGAKPTAANYSGWNLTRNGVQINFGEYQIGPGCLGLVSVVVPYDHLKSMLRQDVGWVNRL
jgi:hypothetical protein